MRVDKRWWAVGLSVLVTSAGIALVGGWAVGVALAAGAGLGVGIAALAGRRTAPSRAVQRHRAALLDVLHAMRAVLREVSPAALDARAGWDQAAFVGALRRVEQLTPALQGALVAYAARASLPEADLADLIAVDRLSAAYTYWTRLFPPREGGESMFVLSLLHDLDETLARAMTVLDAH